jgi:periplasmic protein CpxP/Spy
MQRISSLCKAEPREEVVKFSAVKIAVVAGLLVLLAAFALAQADAGAGEHRGPGGLGSEHRMMRFMGRYLQLSDAQKAQVKQIMANAKPTLTPLMQQLHANRQQLRQLEQSGTFDEEKVRAVAAEQSQILTNLTVERSRMHTQIFNILTPEQKTKAIGLSDRMEKRFQKHLQQTAEPAQQ